MKYDTIIIGAGAAGMMCAAENKGRTLLIDHVKSPGEKIRISGGGRCNFTNMNSAPANFISNNPHFSKSALNRYTQWDFINLVKEYNISYYEKTLGQLFCTGSSKQIVEMLKSQLSQAHVELRLSCSVKQVNKKEDIFELLLEQNGKQVTVISNQLVIATGGKSIPKMGATGFAYEVAKQFSIPLVEPRAALVPLTFTDGRFNTLVGTSVATKVFNKEVSFDEGMIFTHRGLSGPSILQISSYWREGEIVFVNLVPNIAILDELKNHRRENGKRNLSTVISHYLPSRLVEHLSISLDFSGRIADRSDSSLAEIADKLTAWPLTPHGSEGYRTAEVTLGGIDTDALSSKTMMSKNVTGLYFIGEAVDVTGWLGGYNFQWAWSSGWAAGQANNEMLS